MTLSRKIYKWSQAPPLTILYHVSRSTRWQTRPQKDAGPFASMTNSAPTTGSATAPLYSKLAGDGSSFCLLPPRGRKLFASNAWWINDSAGSWTAFIWVFCTALHWLSIIIDRNTPSIPINTGPAGSGTPTRKLLRTDALLGYGISESSSNASDLDRVSDGDVMQEIGEDQGSLRTTSGEHDVDDDSEETHRIRALLAKNKKRAQVSKRKPKHKRKPKVKLQLGTIHMPQGDPTCNEYEGKYGVSCRPDERIVAPLFYMGKQQGTERQERLLRMCSKLLIPNNDQIYRHIYYQKPLNLINMDSFITIRHPTQVPVLYMLLNHQNYPIFHKDPLIHHFFIK